MMQVTEPQKKSNTSDADPEQSALHQTLNLSDTKELKYRHAYEHRTQTEIIKKKKLF